MVGEEEKGRESMHINVNVKEETYSLIKDVSSASSGPASDPEKSQREIFSARRIFALL